MDILNRIDEHVNESQGGILDKRKMKKTLNKIANKIDLSSLSKKEVEWLYKYIYNDGFIKGERIGYDEGSSEGGDAYEDGKSDGYQKGLKDGKKDGYQEGYEAGGITQSEENGIYEDGYESGKEEGYSEGFKKGKREGFKQGKEVGDLDW